MTNIIYKGLKLIHEADTIPLIQKVIKEFKPEIMIEIGTAYGGLTLVFHEAAPQAELHTYDPMRNVTDTNLFNDNVFFHKEDAFKSKELYEICISKKKKFLFCDGFDKKKEFLTFAPLLNKGDIAGVHDYPSRLWRDWQRGMDVYSVERIIHPKFKELIDGYFEPLEDNKKFENLQKESGEINAYSDRYWIKIK